jgi:hypothetical protein
MALFIRVRPYFSLILSASYMICSGRHQPEITSLPPIVMVILLLCLCAFPYQSSAAGKATSHKKITIMCYMNGDNNLTHEVLHAVDMMETVGSSANLNILALVDGGVDATQFYGEGWDRTKFLYITQDDRIGAINSPVLADMGEQDLGDPQTLHNFIKACLKFPAERYIFCMFAHGRGIIDTDILQMPGKVKSLYISPDDTSRTVMSQPEFHDAVKSALSGSVFDVMIFFSCLTNMVEIGYSLQDLTRYMIASEDEIRIVNDPPGRFQIRGIKFEEIFKQLQVNPSLPAPELGKIAVNSFVAQYNEPVAVPVGTSGSIFKRFAGGLSVVDCRHYPRLAALLNELAEHVTAQLREAATGETILSALRRASSASQRYASFLNQEYYDLRNFLENLAIETTDGRTKRLCQRAGEVLTGQLITYERHTADSDSNGISIYLSNVRLPENVYQAHQQLYRRCRFSKETAWDEMIESSRMRLKYGSKP